jgi:hypothetical protein
LRWGFFFVCCLGSDCHALIRETASPLLQEKAAKQFPGRCQASNKERPRAKAWGLFLFHVSAVTYSSTDGLRHEQGMGCGMSRAFISPGTKVTPCSSPALRKCPPWAGWINHVDSAKQRIPSYTLLVGMI